MYQLSFFCCLVFLAMLMEEASAWKLMEEASIGNLQSYVKGDAAPSTEILELVFVSKFNRIILAPCQIVLYPLL